MNADACHAPLPPETLLAYWLGELDAAGTEAVDAHLLGCDACGAEVDALAALGAGVRAALRAGRVAVVVGAAFVARLAAQGVAVREYRVPAGGSVNCTITPVDEVVVSRLGAPLAGVARLDLLLHPGDGGPVWRSEDIPFDAASDEVVVLVQAARLRGLPACTERCELLAVDERGERRLGEYRFIHRPAAG